MVCSRFWGDKINFYDGQIISKDGASSMESHPNPANWQDKKLRLFVQIRIITASSFIMFVLSSNPSCTNQYRLLVHDHKHDRLFVHDTNKHRSNPIISIINKCLKKHSIAFYCFYYITSYHSKDVILLPSQAAVYQFVKYI